MKGGTSIGLLAAALSLAMAGTQASGINGIKDGTSNRLSMSVTTPKQTQGATFGEKVNAGMHAAGSAVANGASLVVLECGRAACVAAFADGDGYRADLQAMTLTPLAAGQAAQVRKAPAGASLVGGALPGGSILSAAVSSVGSLAGGGGGAAAASYAATGRMAAPAPVPSRSEGADLDLLEPLADGDYVLTVVVEKATSGLKDTLKTNVRVAAPQKVEIVLGFSVEAGVLKTRHDTAKNAIGNIR